MKLVYHKIIALLLLSALQSPSAFAEELADILRNALRNDPALLEASANTEGAYKALIMKWKHLKLGTIQHFR